MAAPSFLKNKLTDTENVFIVVCVTRKQIAAEAIHKKKGGNKMLKFKNYDEQMNHRSKCIVSRFIDT